MSIVIKKKTQASIPSVSTDKVQIFVDSADDKLKYKDENGDVIRLSSEKYVDDGVGAIVINSVFGDGSDGDVTIAGTVTLIRDMYYNNLTIPAGTILNPNGFKVYVKGILSGDGKIQRNGNAGGNGSGGGSSITGGTAGAALNQGTLNADLGGGIGGGSSAGSPAGTGLPAPSSNPSYHNVGGALGAPGVGSYSKQPGAGGVATRGLGYNVALSYNNIIRVLTNPASVSTSILFGPYKGIPGGSGGGGNRTPNSGSGGGGGGGGSGGVMWFCVNICNFTGTREAIGGAGGNGGGDSSDSAGGGGGGGGGIVYLLYRTLTSLGTTVLTGGLGGLTPHTSGANGQNGPDGIVIQIQI